MAVPDPDNQSQPEIKPKYHRQHMVFLTPLQVLEKRAYLKQYYERNAQKQKDAMRGQYQKKKERREQERIEMGLPKPRVGRPKLASR